MTQAFQQTICSLLYCLPYGRMSRNAELYGQLDAMTVTAAITFVGEQLHCNDYKNNDNYY